MYNKTNQCLPFPCNVSNAVHLVVVPERRESNTNHNPKGYGLGLGLAKKLTEGNGPEVRWVEINNCAPTRTYCSLQLGPRDEGFHGIPSYLSHEARWKAVSVGN